MKASTRPPYLNAVACPHCLEPARVRSSKQVTSLIRQLYPVSYTHLTLPTIYSV